MPDSSHLPELPSKNMKRSQNVNSNHHLPVQTDKNKSQPASIELPNGASNVDGK